MDSLSNEALATLLTHEHGPPPLQLEHRRDNGHPLSRRYLTTLWIPALQNAFPNTDLDANSLQRSIENDVQQLHFLRNRAAHHEPLLRRDLHDDLDRARRVMTCISPVAGNWLDERQLISDVVAARPEPPHI